MDSIIPEIDIDEEVIIDSLDVATTDTVPVQRGKSFNFDFVTGDFIIKDGKLQTLENIESLKLWIVKLLKTEKFKFQIYETGLDSEYGTTLINLVHSDAPYFWIQTQIKREIADELMKNTEILSVGNFVLTREKRTLTVNFTVNSIYGLVESEVSL